MEQETRLRREICRIGKKIYENGMAAANDGNISVRLDAGIFLCTPTGISKGDMTPDGLCIIDEAGHLLSAQKDYRPSSEIKMHLKVYEKRADVNAVVHAHPAYATTFAVGEEALNQAIISEAVISLGCVPVAEYGLPSTQEIPNAVEPYLAYFDSMLLAHHGALSYGADLTSAYYRMESLELYARLLYQSRLAGMQKELDKETVHSLCIMREKAGMKNPEEVCVREEYLFDCCKKCKRHKLSGD